MMLNWLKLGMQLEITTLNGKCGKKYWSCYHGNQQCTREHALGYYINARNVEQIANIYFIMEEFDKLEELAETLPENHTLLQVCITNYTITVNTLIY